MHSSKKRLSNWSIFFHTDRGSYVEKLMSNEEKTGDTNYSAFLKVGDRIVWLSDYGPQYGTVKWIGHLPEADTTDLVAGIEFVSV